MTDQGHTPESGERDRLVFLPLGGAGEIGMNLYLYGYGPDDDRQWIMVDLGVKFADQREPGIDVIFPDTSYIESERSSLQGILLTHAHEDHFGAVIEMAPRLEAPVYATPFTANLLRAKLAERSREGTVRIKEIALSAAGSTWVRLMLSTSTLPIQFPNHARWRSGRRLAMSCIPATGRSTTIRSSAHPSMSIG